MAKLALDSKGRLAIPARHRDILQERYEGKLVITADPSHCLLLYPLVEWEPIQIKLMALPSFNDQSRTLQRLLVGHASDVELDAAGRILVPPELRAYARLDKHVALVGQNNKFELWDEAAWDGNWQAESGRLPVDPNAMPPELNGFAL
jgi:MraZ protein